MSTATKRIDTETYLDADEAAAYLRYTVANGYADPLRAFLKFVRRKGVPKCRTGRRLLFRRVDLDRSVAPAIEKKPLRRAS